MARKTVQKSPESTPEPKVQTGSVFISHVHEDEQLAEAFAMLIQSVSAGAIPTFRSSSKTLGEGIQYGEEWFHWICESVNAASHTVALVTPASTGRPWILFEAGLGKARPDGTVFGVALGIAREDAYKGPFAVLQNCGTEKSELKKLCKQLIEGKNLNPPEEMIDRCVDDFRAKVDSHFKNAKSKVVAVEEQTNTLVFRALEEMKLMLREQGLIYRETEGYPLSARRSRRLLPVILDEVSMFISPKGDDPIGLLILASFLRDDMPPLYELAIDTVTILRNGKPSEKLKALNQLEMFLDYLNNSSLLEELGYRSKESGMAIVELTRLLHRYILRMRKTITKSTSPAP